MGQTDAKNQIATPKRTAKQPLTTAAKKKKAGLRGQVLASLQDLAPAMATEAPENTENIAIRIEQQAPLQTGAKKEKGKGKGKGKRNKNKPIEESVDQAKTVRAPEVDQAKKVNAPEVENSAGITTSDQQAPMQTDAKNQIATPKRTSKQPLTTAAKKKKAGLRGQVLASLQDLAPAMATEAPENTENIAIRIEQQAPLQTGAKKKKGKGKGK